MQRIKHPPLRNKINLAEPTEVRAWTRRLGISADALKAVVDKAPVVAHRVMARMLKSRREPCRNRSLPRTANACSATRPGEGRA